MINKQCGLCCDNNWY